MSQNKTTSIFKALTLITIGFLTFACAPKKQGIRATVKTASTSLNPGAAPLAEQQATAQNAIYKISSISTPAASGDGVAVTSELLNPSNQYLPVTTQHGNGSLDSSGIFNDSSRGLMVHVNSRCSDPDCTKYLLLVTVFRNNQAVFQSGAISFKDDCNFFTISNTASTGSMYQNIGAFDSATAGQRPSGDNQSCIQ